MKESQLNNKTSIATNDYVRMVDENNNSVKIKKDSFMAAIRDALPSIISDGATGAGSVLSIIGGALKTRTDANLASVLGGGGTIRNADLAPSNTCSYCSSGSQNIPLSDGFLYTFHETKDNPNGYKMQLFWHYSTKRAWMRRQSNTTWNEWEEIALDIPSFYKSYSTLAELKAALANT